MEQNPYELYEELHQAWHEGWLEGVSSASQIEREKWKRYGWRELRLEEANWAKRVEKAKRREPIPVSLN